MELCGFNREWLVPRMVADWLGPLADEPGCLARVTKRTVRTQSMSAWKTSGSSTRQAPTRITQHPNDYC